MNAPGHRLQWPDLPQALRDEITGVLGTAVVEAVGQRGGYGPSLAARCRLADGRRVFIKAVSPAQNADSPGMMRREARINGRLPHNAPAPALLHTVDDGEWIALVFEEVAGRLPEEPWAGHELLRVLRATRELGELAPRGRLPTLAQQYGAMFTGWRALVEEPDEVSNGWCRDRLAELAAAEARWEQVTVGDRLIHGDVRSDNVLMTENGGVVFVDWTSTCVGVGWFDVVAMLPAVALEGGGDPESVMAAIGLDLEVGEMLPLVAAFSGYFAERGRLPDLPGLPTLRPFQRAQGEVTDAWLRRLWDRA